jgi:hypothetical protein
MVVGRAVQVGLVQGEPLAVVEQPDQMVPGPQEGPRRILLEAPQVQEGAAQMAVLLERPQLVDRDQTDLAAATITWAVAVALVAHRRRLRRRVPTVVAEAGAPILILRLMDTALMVDQETSILSLPEVP